MKNGKQMQNTESTIYQLGDTDTGYSFWSSADTEFAGDTESSKCSGDYLQDAIDFFGDTNSGDSIWSPSDTVIAGVAGYSGGNVSIYQSCNTDSGYSVWVTADTEFASDTGFPIVSTGLVEMRTGVRNGR